VDGLDLPFAILDDGTDVRAPIAGVIAGLRAAASDVSVVLPIDTPRITTEALEALADACRDAAVPQTGPLPGAYRKSSLPALEAALAAGALSLRDAIAGLNVAQVEVDPALLTNINTPNDLL
jgi:molybdopterin-guanine dinucleotide biosynthesis protein A